MVESHTRTCYRHVSSRDLVLDWSNPNFKQSTSTSCNKSFLSDFGSSRKAKDSPNIEYLYISNTSIQSAGSVSTQTQVARASEPGASPPVIPPPAPIAGPSNQNRAMSVDPPESSLSSASGTNSSTRAPGHTAASSTEPKSAESKPGAKANAKKPKN